MRTDELVTGHAERSDESDACDGEVLGRKPMHTTRRDPVNKSEITSNIRLYARAPARRAAPPVARPTHPVRNSGPHRAGIKPYV